LIRIPNLRKYSLPLNPIFSQLQFLSSHSFLLDQSIGLRSFSIGSPLIFILLEGHLEGGFLHFMCKKYIDLLSKGKYNDLRRYSSILCGIFLLFDEYVQ